MEMGYAMLRILSSACPSTDNGDNNYNEYHIETHCVAWTIVAKVAERDSEGCATLWDIKSMKAEDC